MKHTTLPVFLLCLLPLAGRADDWPQWRGPDRTGLSKETGLLKSWPKSGPKLLWEAEGAGAGYASVVISKGKIFTLGDSPSTADDKNEYVLCFDDNGGKQLWKTKVGPVWDRNYPGGRSTPTIDGDLLYVVTPHGVVFCLETATGKEVWRKDLTKDFGGGKGDGWGYSESPLIDGDWVVCTPGKEKNTMVALDKKDAKTIWTTPSKGDRGAGHSSIVISHVGGVKVYVQTTASGPIGVRAKDGKLLWTYPIDKTTAVIPTPIVRGDLVFFSAGYGRGGALLRQVPASDDTVKVEEVYPLNRALNNRHGGIVLLGDYIYGDTDQNGNLFCAELKTGKSQWKKGERPSGSGSTAITAADGRLYLRYASGNMVLAEVNPKEYKEVGSFKIPGSGAKPSWSHPVVCNGKLYLREQDKILCYDIKDSGGSR
jgi:outer membrane protein assembly factor BamB